MSFLQPIILFGLPLIALPILIHLIHQRRFQTVQWAAMAFLLAATKMSKGYARLRQWLILAARTLAIAGLVFAVSRPLSSGWLGLAAGGRVDTTIILLDRSASMSQVGVGGQSKLEAGVKRLYESLGKLESDHYVLIDSVGMRVIELSSVDQLEDLVEYNGASATADIPAMLELVDEYLKNQKPSRTEVWICSDHRIADWNPGSGRWKSFRDGVGSRSQSVRFHSLAFENAAIGNSRLLGKAVRRVEGEESGDLLLSFRLQREASESGSTVVPIQLELDGVVKEIQIEMSGKELDVTDYVVPIDPAVERGWGRLSLPSDTNEQDNHFYFTYQKEPIRRTLIVADDQELVRPLLFAASVTSNPGVIAEADSCAPRDVVSSAAESYSLVLWQSAIPAMTDPEFLWLQAHRNRGGVIIFFPPESTSLNSNEFASIKWGDWMKELNQVTSWELEQDLLSNTRSGKSLPVGEVKVQRYLTLFGEYTTLASLGQGDPVLVKAIDSGGAVYFCATSVSSLDSNLATSGVVLFAMLQRAMEQGAKSQGFCRLTDAKRTPFQVQWPRGTRDVVDDWSQVAGGTEIISTEQPSHAGVYQSGPRWLAVNRSEVEDNTEVVSDETLATLFEGLSFRTVRDEVGAERSLIQEVWRLFLVIMLLMLLTESALSLPRRSIARNDLLQTRVTGIDLAGSRSL